MFSFLFVLSVIMRLMAMCCRKRIHEKNTIQSCFIFILFCCLCHCGFRLYCLFSLSNNDDEDQKVLLLWKILKQNTMTITTWTTNCINKLKKTKKKSRYYSTFTTINKNFINRYNLRFCVDICEFPFEIKRVWIIYWWVIKTFSTVLTKYQCMHV